MSPANELTQLITSHSRIRHKQAGEGNLGVLSSKNDQLSKKLDEFAINYKIDLHQQNNYIISTKNLEILTKLKKMNL